MDPSEEIIDEYFEYLADRDVYRYLLNDISNVLPFLSIGSFS